MSDQRAHGTMGAWLEGARTQALRDATAQAGIDAPAPTGRRGATVDDDEHLAAYNAFLARINAAEPPRSDGPAR
jgi:hypothetical protein